MVELYNPFASGYFGGFLYLLDMWGEALLSCLGGITANHCCRFNMKKCGDFKESNPSMGNNALSLCFAALYSAQFSCKCIIWMSVQWAHYLYFFQAKYFQEAVLLLALYSGSLSSMEKTNHEKSLFFSCLYLNIFVLFFLGEERNAVEYVQIFLPVIQKPCAGTCWRFRSFRIIWGSLRSTEICYTVEDFRLHFICSNDVGNFHHPCRNYIPDK